MSMTSHDRHGHSVPTEAVVTQMLGKCLGRGEVPRASLSSVREINVRLQLACLKSRAPKPGRWHGLHALEA